MKLKQTLLSLTAFFLCLGFYLLYPVLSGNSAARTHTVTENKSPGEYHLVPVLCFHNVDGKGIYALDHRKFRQYMTIIRDEGVQVVSLKQLYRHAMENRLFKKPSLVITVDDDYSNISRVAAPILREFGYPATFFVYISDIADNPRYGMSWDDLQRLRSEGFDIQNHSYTHTRLHHPRPAEEIGQYLERLHREIDTSRQTLESKIPGLKIYAFAFPMGFHNDFLKQKLLDSGYMLLLTTDAYPVDLTKPFVGVFDRYTVQKRKYIRNPQAMFLQQLAFARKRLRKKERIGKLSAGR